jgi:hypothetical protein
MVALVQGINKENGDTLWWDSIIMEMKNRRPAFQWWEKTKGELPIGYQKIKCHFVFDVKMGKNFWQKT